jgi:hypothetical protein
LGLSSAENAIPIYRESDSITVYQIVDGIVNHDDLASRVKLYPNPTQAMLNAEVAGTQIESWAVVNVLGQTLMSGENTSQGSLAIDVNQLKSGFYYIQLETKNGLVSKAFQRR